jgi:hypothetical protein
VSHNWVAGKILLKDGKLQTLNESSLIRSAQRWRDKTVPDQSPTGQ